MIRVISFRKAIAAGVAGAAVMELYSVAGRVIGLPTVDLVQQLSSLDLPGSPVLAIAAAIAAHLGIGVCWAVFYAFFFWGRLRLRPAIQGLLFAVIPATLAILVVYPELALMRRGADLVTLDLRTYLA